MGVESAIDRRLIPRSIGAFMDGTIFSGKAVLITGAAGGLGRGLVAAFASSGWRVIAATHRPSDFVESEDVWPVQLDVTDRLQIENVVSRGFARFGRLDVLINNAGITDDQLFFQMDEAAWQRVLDVNLKGAFRCSQAVIRLMLKQREGHIINVSSYSARTGHAGQAAYAASKAGLIGLTQSLAREAGSRNVRVNAILPGVLPTAMTAKLNTQRLAELASDNTLGRINSVDEVARFMVFLAGMQNVSGQVFQLDSRIGRWV